LISSAIVRNTKLLKIEPYIEDRLNLILMCRRDEECYTQVHEVMHEGKGRHFFVELREIFVYNFVTQKYL